MKKITFYCLMFISIAQGQSYNMKNEAIQFVVNACAFYDSGGKAQNYSNSEKGTTTFYPSEKGKTIQLRFTAFQLENGKDILKIYDGGDASCPLIGTYTGTCIPPTITSSSKTGGLTVVFTSNEDTNYGGWEAQISNVNETLLPPACVTNRMAGNSCQEATPICNLNGYCGNTSTAYTINSWPELSAAFCGSIDNNSFLSFVASANTTTLNVWVLNSENEDGIQMMIFSAASCGKGKIDPIYCWNPGYVPQGPTKLTIKGLTPGKTYYIMVDGWAKDVCDYIIGAESGIVTQVKVDSATNNICLGNSLLLKASGGNGAYTWTSEGGTLNAYNGESVIFTPSKIGTFKISATADNGEGFCDKSSTSSTRTIVVRDGHSIPTFAAVPPIYRNMNTPKLPPTSLEGFTGVWSPEMIDINNTKTYVFTPDSNQCADKSTLTVVVLSDIITPIATITQYPSCSKPLGTFEVTSPIHCIFEYSINGSDFQSSPLFKELKQGTYHLVVRNTITGKVSAPLSLNVIPLTSNDPILIEAGCKEGQYTLTSILQNLEVTYEWFNEENDAIGNDSYLAINEPGVYTLAITTPEGCVFKKEIQANPTLCSIPKGISPNGDGLNDRFDLSEFKVQKLIIYDRFGVEQFSKEGGYTDQWEGQGSNGHTMTKGTYYYVIQQANNVMNTGWVYIN